MSGFFATNCTNFHELNSSDSRHFNRFEKLEMNFDLAAEYEFCTLWFGGAYGRHGQHPISEFLDILASCPNLP